MTVSLFHLICLILGFSMEINQKIMLHITSEGDHNCPGQAGISIFSLQKKDMAWDLALADLIREDSCVRE